MLVLSTVIGAANGFLGLYLSYFVDASPGATIVLLGAALFCVALVYSFVRERFSGVRGPASERMIAPVDAHVA
jgi:ABC-type Mn2+/Zn2+ transport system permease subunit